MNTTHRPDLQVIVLAAGHSRRLARSKAMVRVRGTTLLRNTVATVSGLSVRPPIVIVPPRARALRSDLQGMPVQFVTNTRRAAGQSASVRLGLRHARYATAVLLLPCDLVALERRELLRLIRRWQGVRGCIVGRRIAPRRAGTPLIMPRRYMQAAKMISGDTGLREFLLGVPAERQRLVDLPSAAADVDTPTDLAAARRRWRGRPYKPLASLTKRYPTAVSVRR